MAFFDLSTADLDSYRSGAQEPEDFDAFWDATLAETRRHPLAIDERPAATGLRLIETRDVTFGGFGGHPVRAWLHVPAGVRDPLPCVVQFHGYSHGRGYPHGDTLFAQAGYAQLVVDNRGQGWQRGSLEPTADPDPAAGDARPPGLLTSGIADPYRYFYRRMYADAARAVEFAAQHPAVEGRAIMVTGRSQGGGLAIAAASLAPRLGVAPVACAPDVPFLCDLPRAIGLTDSDPYAELTRLFAARPELEQPALRTLAMVDNVHHAARATMPSLWSVALMDTICPPSTVFGAYHAWAGQAQIEVYRFNGHEGGGEAHQAKQLAYAHEVFGG